MIWVITVSEPQIMEMQKFWSSPEERIYIVGFQVRLFQVLNIKLIEIIPILKM
jgi:hypothetical protein